MRSKTQNVSPQYLRFLLPKADGDISRKFLPDFPNGLLPIGDAICRFNPVYGQGMTLAFQEANLLFDLLGTLDGSQPATLAPTFLTKAEMLIADPWAMSAIPDFIYQETTGERPADLEDHLNFQRALGRLAVRDAEVLELLTEISTFSSHSLY